MDYFTTKNNMSDMLDLSMSSAPMQAITSRNATESSLLAKLPAEITSKIFEEVVGGKAIHATIKLPCNGISFIPQDGHQYLLDLCKNSETVTDPTTPRVRQKSASTNLQDKVFVERHPDCCVEERQNVGKALDLDVLLVCRQFYSEAAMLPFTANTFTVEFGLGREKQFIPSVNVLQVFLNTLAPAQRVSIRHLAAIASHIFHREDSRQIERLENLVSLKVMHTLVHDPDQHKDWPNHDGWSWQTWSRDLCMSRLKVARFILERQSIDSDPKHQENIDVIEQALRKCETGLLDRARNPGLVVEVEDEDDAFSGGITEDDYWLEEEDDEDDDWNFDDGAGDGFDLLRRLQVVRLGLPRDGATAQDAVAWVMEVLTT